MLAHALLIGALLAPRPDDPALPAPPSRGKEWRLLNQVEVVVNERITTTAELVREAQAPRAEDEQLTEELLLERLGDERQKRMQTLLEDQAGRDIGYDPEAVERSVDRLHQRNIERWGGIGPASDKLREQQIDTVQLEGQMRESVYANLWREWQLGITPGPAGRVSQDRYVRPGILRLAYDANPEGHRIAGQVSLQQLILAYGSEADEVTRENARQQIESLRQAIANGADMGDIVERYGSTRPGTQGLLTVPEDALREAFPEIAAFLDEAEPGELSEVMPYVRDEGGAIGVLVLRFLGREEGRDFQSYEVQERMRRERQRELDQRRIEESRLALLRQAYVWPTPPPWPPAPADAGAPPAGPPEATAEAAP